MSERDEYPAGVPCWVEGLHRDVPAALDFYGPLFGWEWQGSSGEPEYFVARLRGRDVAGIAPMPESVTDGAAWMTHVAVASAADTAEAAAAAGGSVLAGPIDLQPAGRLAVIADPAGAVICAWEADARRGAQLVNEPDAWAVSALHTDDPVGAIAFYGALFGWQAEPFGPPEGGISMLRLPGFVGGEAEQPVPRDVVAVMMPLGDAPAPHWSVDFWISDTHAVAAHAAELAGDVVVAPHEAPPFIQAVLADPQGATFSVSQLVLPAS